MSVLAFRVPASLCAATLLLLTQPATALAQTDTEHSSSADASRTHAVDASPGSARSGESGAPKASADGQDLRLSGAELEPVGAFDLGAGIAGLWIESLALFAAVSYAGWVDWEWGTASFRVDSEGWFGGDTGSGGMDKLGHLFISYVIADVLSLRLQARGRPGSERNIYPALFAWTLMLYVEVFDGFSVDHGWSNEDVVMNTAGVALAYLRNLFPDFRQLVDLRYQYFPSPGTGFHPYIDYSGQTYFAVLKLAGIRPFEDTPASLIELHVGYRTRGFRSSDRYEGRRRDLFVGAGLNLSKLLLEPLKDVLGPVHEPLDIAQSYYQVPYTYTSKTVYSRRWEE